MPVIRSISTKDNTLTFVGSDGIEQIFDASDIPPDKDSIAKLEAYINTDWLPPLTRNEFQMAVHIFRLSPLELTAYTTDIGRSIPSNWWSE